MDLKNVFKKMSGHVFKKKKVWACFFLQGLCWFPADAFPDLLVAEDASDGLVGDVFLIDFFQRRF